MIQSTHFAHNVHELTFALLYIYLFDKIALNSTDFVQQRLFRPQNKTRPTSSVRFDKLIRFNHRFPRIWTMFDVLSEWAFCSGVGGNGRRYSMLQHQQISNESRPIGPAHHVTN